MIAKIKKFFQKHKRVALGIGIGVVTLAVVSSLVFYWYKNQQLASQIGQLGGEKATLQEQLAAISQKFEELKSDDQFVRNEKLQETIKNIEITYNQAVKVYENLLSLKEQTQKTSQQDEQFTDALSLLSERNYASAAATLTALNKQISQEKEKIAAAFTIPENVPAQNIPPGSGYQRQKVTTSVGTFMVSLVAADLNTTRVIVDTASESDCHNDCPILPLASYVARNGAFAGINGTYFCPAVYPSCAGRKNTFEFLVMNKNKVYFNSDKNVYSTIPAAIFYGNTARFVTQSLEWGRDTGVDAVIANYPLLLLNGQIMFGGSDDSKLNVRGNRSFIGIIGNTVYIGIVHNVSVAESAQVLKALGLNHALNLDNGGSTALWSGGYKVGPGRNLPNVILLVRK